MKEKAKNFPLKLASVVDNNNDAGRANSSRSQTATPQTATRNVARNNATNATNAANAADAARRSAQTPSRTRPAEAAASERASPLVSAAVRKAMVARVAKQGVSDKKVLAALEAVPRHMFIESGMSSQAYVDASLPIGHHQTISQPYIVARMIEVMRNNGNGGVLNRVLEIGTGCGYQAAVLSLVAKEVYSIERIKALHELARTNLRPLRIANIRLHYGDGMLGFPQVAPFDGIILAAAGLEVPRALLEQMTIGGRLVAPVGERHQVLQLIERTSQFDWTSSTLEECHFVPLHSGTV